ncbi:MAG: helix-turn-helix domain-containing protein [Verrucomicrobiales bacterium]|nr:helix-turn-helix domain-containing protein [Verrucomicrobiales bacterium]
MSSVSVAEQLRRAREAQGLTLHDLAEVTKIRADHLEALEKADYDPFPAPVYIRGSVRTYASFLKLDVPAVLSALDSELARSPEHSGPPSLTGQRRGPLDWLTYQLSRINWRLVAVLAVLVAAIAGGSWGWRRWNRQMREDPLSKLGPGIYRAAPTTGDLLPMPTNAASRR